MGILAQALPRPQGWVSTLMGMVYYGRLAIGISYKSVVDSTARSPIDI